MTDKIKLTFVSISILVLAQFSLFTRDIAAQTNQIFENERYWFEQDERAIDNSLSSYLSGQHIVLYRDNLLTHVQSSYNTYVVNFINLSDSQGLLRTDVVSQLQQHRTLWLNYMQTETNSHLSWAGSGQISDTVSYLDGRIRAIHNNAVAQLDANITWYTPPPPPPDKDRDGTPDSSDNCPSNWNSNQLDTDRDGKGNVCDSDDDNDGVIDSQDAFPLNRYEWLDTDKDAIGNNADTDDDGDGIPDNYELKNGLNPLNGSDALKDKDGDGFSNLAEYRAKTDLNDPLSIPNRAAATIGSIFLLLGNNPP